MRSILGSLGLSLLLLSFGTGLLEAEPLRLPYPRALFHKVEFWKMIYTRYTTKQGVLHDSDDLSIIYEDVQLPKGGSKSIVGRQRAKIRQALFSILRKRGQNLTAYERKVLSRFPKYASRSRLLQATENIRFQLGQSNRFKKGLINSGKYMSAIEKIIKEEGAPDFLKYLPNVESSFQEKAMSKFGAAGLWQLMPRTGRQFLKVDYSLDERLDPWIATRAAIKYLKQNHRTLGEWPLAITAYNHGAGGVRRAVRTLGTTDIAEIAFQYSTRSFGFASRNFYTQFLAAVQVAQDYKKYFGNIKIEKSLKFDEIKIKRPIYFKQFSKKYRFQLAAFKELNLALRKPVYRNRRPIPKGAIIRLPKGSGSARVQVASLDKKVIKRVLEAVPDRASKIEIRAPQKPLKKSSKAKLVKKKETKTVPEKEVALPQLEENIAGNKYVIRDYAGGKGWVRVEINETISQIAEWLDEDIDDVREWNGIEDQGQFRLGQRVLIKAGQSAANHFIQARKDYHRQIREDFFSQYKVDSFVDYEVQMGENLWSICFQKFDLPPWLLEEFNPQVDLSEIKSGLKLKIPVVVEQFAGISEAATKVVEN